MRFVSLGRTGVRVSELCFGTMSFGGDADADTALAMYRRCREAGINFFDCADMYQQGRAEEILGRCMAGHRDELVVTSKVFNPLGDDINARGLSRRHIVLAVEDSLRRLKTDRLDVYFCHQFDAATPIEETLRAMDDLVRQGKVLYPALSNWTAWQVEKALGVCALRQLAPVACLQPMYNLVKRAAEIEILPMAQAEGLGVIAYSPLGGGLLTGKYGVDRRPESGRLVDKDNYRTRYGLDEYYRSAERFTAFAADKELNAVSLAVSWVLHHPAVTAPIIGARNLEQLEPSLRAVEIRLSAEERAEISALGPAPPPATDRLEEAAGPK